jgi:hypothetical protein
MREGLPGHRPGGSVGVGQFSQPGREDPVAAESAAEATAATPEGSTKTRSPRRSVETRKDSGLCQRGQAAGPIGLMCSYESAHGSGRGSSVKARICCLLAGKLKGWKLGRFPSSPMVSVERFKRSSAVKRQGSRRTTGCS